jgi:hypothetical protein
MIRHEGPLSESRRSNVCVKAWANVRRWPASVRSLAGIGLHFSLFSHFKRVVDFNSEVSNRTFQSIDCSQ